MAERRAGLTVATLALGLALLPACGGSADGPTAGEDPFAFPAADSVPGIDLAVAVEPGEVALLDEVEVRVSLWLHDGIGSEFEPSVPTGFTGAVPAPSERRVAVGSGVVRTWRCSWRAVELGELQIPAWTATGTAAVDVPPFAAAGEELEARSAPRTVTVRGVLAETLPEAVDADAIEAPGGLFAPRVPWFGLGLGALVALGAVVALILWLRRRRRRAPQTGAAVEVPAHVEALRALARLRHAPRDSEAEIDGFYVAVSDVLRRYLERRFGLHAPERTTEEFLPELERSGVLDGSQRQHLARFLEQCDLVKFAGVRPAAEVHERTFEFAEELVHATRADRPGSGAAQPAPLQEAAS